MPPGRPLTGTLRSFAPSLDRHEAGRGQDEVHQTVRRATEMLEVIWAAPRPARLADVARAAGLDRSTALRLLRSLEVLGYVHRDPATKIYRIGYMAQRLGTRAHLMATTLELATPFLENLAAAAGETVVVATLEGVSVVVQLCVAAPGPPRTPALRVGTAYPAHASALGKALLGNLAPDELRLLYAETRLVRLATRTITDLGTLEDEVARARQLGWARERDEGDEGRAGVALPGVNSRRTANFAIGLIGRTAAIDEARERQLVAALSDAGRAIYAHIIC